MHTKKSFCGFCRVLPPVCLWIPSPFYHISHLHLFIGWRPSMQTFSRFLFALTKYNITCVYSFNIQVQITAFFLSLSFYPSPPFSLCRECIYTLQSNLFHHFLPVNIGVWWMWVWVDELSAFDAFLSLPPLIWFIFTFSFRADCVHACIKHPCKSFF